MVCQNVCDVVNLNWLPIEENVEINTVKLAHNVKQSKSETVIPKIY